MSVLESSSATKRDARQYLQTFGKGKPKAPSSPKTAASLEGQRPANAYVLEHGTQAVSDSPKFIQGTPVVDVAALEAIPHVAIIKFREPQSVDDLTLKGVAKTLAQLRALGLPSVVVVDCELDPHKQPNWRALIDEQANRIASAIDAYGEPWTRIVDTALSTNPQETLNGSLYTPSALIVGNGKLLLNSLRAGSAVVIPSYASSAETQQMKFADTNEVVLSLTRYLSGLQFSPQTNRHDAPSEAIVQPSKKAHIDRVIVLDPLGGIPAKHRSNNAHVFLNLEDEFVEAKADLDTMAFNSDPNTANFVKQKYTENLELAKKTLAILPSTSSALMTTPIEAANLASRVDDGFDGRITGFVGTVGTRRTHNPLIHNLLTDRPAHSSSLPLGRIKPIARGSDVAGPTMSTTTLAKRGMPVTIFPDPRKTPWVPPAPGQPRLKLTDRCIDLPRLVHLIDDSFNRKLDVQHYLDRVNGNLAGIIIAGEYEGGAILTWEKPPELDEETAYRTGRLVPYLDKFAVLKKSQGAGGVADIVFNAMVHDCFPGGVCWRSRKNNPVNKWYFERSRGTWKLGETDWAMFWTTPNVTIGDERIRDYEQVCRNIAPSWADKKHIVD